MKRCCWVLVAVVAILLGVRGAAAGERTELWMWSAPPGAPADAEATATFVGSMANGERCRAVAEVMTGHMRATSAAVAVFECHALGDRYTR